MGTLCEIVDRTYHMLLRSFLMQGRRHAFEKGGGGTESLKKCPPP